MEKEARVDTALVARGLVQSREKAQRLIAAGLVTVNQRAVLKPSLRVRECDELAVLGADIPYVSRGGLKLEKALKTFDVRPAGMVCMDIGASTGGFTDVLLQNGAKRVYAIDVGTSQLARSLREDSRVVSMERVNARELTPEMFPEAPTLAVMDVSFISVRLILPAAFRVLGENGRLIALVKPQFEAGRQHIGKGGIVSSASVHLRVLEELVAFVQSLGWQVRGLDYSPITGGDGNIEFLADMSPKDDSLPGRVVPDIPALVGRAHAALLHGKEK